MPLVASAVAQHAPSPAKNPGSQARPRPLAGPTTIPASRAAWKAARVLGETTFSPRGRIVPSMSVRMSFTAMFFSLARQASRAQYMTRHPSPAASEATAPSGSASITTASTLSSVPNHRRPGAPTLLWSMST